MEAVPDFDMYDDQPSQMHRPAAGEMAPPPQQQQQLHTPPAGE